MNQKYRALHYGELIEWNQLRLNLTREESEDLRVFLSGVVFVEENINPRKRDYRTEQWENAIPIARKLWEKNKAIKVEEIKVDPEFKACFKNGLPSDDRVRHQLNKAGIKLASGRR